MTDPRWIENLPLVRFTLNRMRLDGELQQPLDDDLLQEGYLAVGRALQTHDPARGKLSTWLCHQARYAALTYLRKANAGGVSSAQHVARMVGLPPEDVDGPGLTYTNPPAGYADPGDEATGSVLLAQLRFALSLLRPKDAALLDTLYGLTDDPVPAADYAREHGLQRTAVSMRHTAAVRRLAGLMGI